jgi:hypothetical protein
LASFDSNISPTALNPEGWESDKVMTNDEVLKQSVE